MPSKLVENKFSGTSRLSNLEPAVNRQPGFPRDVARREGSACAMASTVILLKRETLPELPELLKIINTPCMCDTTCHSNKSIDKSKIVFRQNLRRIPGRSRMMPVTI